MKQDNPTLTIIAGVNGSGKTTFALDYFKDSQTTFINADLIATGLSPNNPDLSQFRAGKLMLIEIKKCIKNRKNFAIETTLASKNYLKLINRLKQNNWQVQMLYLYLPNVNLSIDRVAERVRNGGHNIRLEDIKRRYNRSIENLINDYFSAIDSIICIGNENHSELIFNKNKDNLTVYNQSIMDEILRVKNVKR